MIISVGKTSGFCFGVKRAVDTVFENANKNVCTLGPIIHNQIVTDELNKKGVQIISNLNQANGRTVIIRAHGIPKHFYAQMKNMGINYIDCTCPFVKKIHHLVEKNYNDGKKIIIIGNPNHPEIIGINGYANNCAHIIKNLDEAKSFHVDTNFQYILVVQTTFSFELFNQITKYLSCDNIQIFNTICDTTQKRQIEAENLSKISNKMIVIGDSTSSNTTKLFNICQKNCCNTFFIHNISDLLLNKFNIDDKIGIVAGASTPSNVIKEAIFLMEQLVCDEKDFEQLLNESFVTLHTGEIVKGTVIQISRNEVIVDLGYKSDGIITKENFSNSNEPLCQLTNIGDEVEAIIFKIDDGEGNVLLSKKKLDLQRGLKLIEKAFNENSIVTGKIIDTVKGGVIVLAENVKLFAPISHLSNSYIDNINSYIGKTMDFNIIEFNRAKHRYVASRKKIISSPVSKIKAADEIEGTITKILDFGMIVNLGDDCDGLLHILQIDNKDKDLKDKFNIGDKIKVFVIKIDEAKNKISLSMKNPKENPWYNISQRYPQGKIVEGKVARINDYGAFIYLEPSIDGLLHISQISNEHTEKVSDELKIGDVIKLRVLASDENKKRVSLSMIDVEQ